MSNTPGNDEGECAQPEHFVLTRRKLLTAATGATLLLHELALGNKPGTAPLDGAISTEGMLLHGRPNLKLAATADAAPAAAQGWSGAPGKARYRIEGMLKVTGQKIYARDFRAKDMKGWPVDERVAMILRADRADQLLSFLNLSMLDASSLPMQVIVQKSMSVQPLSLKVQALDGLQLTMPFASQGPNCTAPTADCKQPPVCTPNQLLLPVGQAAQYLGQPVAILIFADLGTYRRAKRLLQFNPQVIGYGTKKPVLDYKIPYNPPIYLTRFDVPGPPGREPFSQVQKGAESNPNLPNSPCSPYNSEAKNWRSVIDGMIASPQVKSFTGRYTTQVLDPMFMEPESGLAWQDRTGKGTMHLVLGTQATNGDASDISSLFSKAIAPLSSFTNIALYACYPGGGFGGRDVSTFPILLALTAGFADAPVRIAQDRYEQFQGGLKQLGSDITHTLAVSPNGQFTAFKSQQTLIAGGNNNYSQFVAMLTGYCGLSGYNILAAYVDAAAKPSEGVVAGSMRGFGGPQASFAVETLVDEAAVAMNFDPIDLRQRNALVLGNRTITGAPIEQTMRLQEICQRARSHPLWQNRAATKLAKARQGIAYGVGFALANQAYGTGTDGVMAQVSLSADGQLTVRSNCVDMGNGSATTLAISTAGFAGNNAAQVAMGDIASFSQLKMTSGGTVRWKEDASWTASFSMSSSACLTAFHQVHVTEQATRALFQAGLLPAAAALWNKSVAELQGKTSWANGLLNAPGLPALSLPQLAQKIFQSQLPAEAMVHGLYQGSWVAAQYAIGGGLQSMPIDGLAIRPAGTYTDPTQGWQGITRQNVIPPDPKAHLYGRSLYAPSGALVSVEIDPCTGNTRVTNLELIVDAGKVLQSDLLIGQAQGGIAMGIGYALLEDLPLKADGAGNGRWNLDRYHVALASDMPRDSMNITTLPTQETTAKGIAEAVLCPIAPAIGNAIAYATGHRFRSLPIKPEQIRQILPKPPGACGTGINKPQGGKA